MTAVEGETRVDVTLPGDRKCDVSFGRIRLFCGDVIHLHLLPFETASFHSRSDLSGTTVTSSTGKVAVYAGNSGITVGPGSVTDQTMSQLLPVTQWGARGVEDDADSFYDYVVPSIPDNDHSGYSIRVSSGGVNTSVVAVTTGDTRRHVLRAGQVLTLDFADNVPVLLRADAPLQVVQFVRGAAVPSDSGAPASQIIPERRQYASLYAFTNPPGYVHYVIVVIDSSASLAGLVVDDVTVETDDDGSGWTPVGGATLVTRGILMMRDGYSTVSHRAGVKFGAFRYSYIRGNCAYAYPAGVATAANQVSVHVTVQCIQWQ